MRVLGGVLRDGSGLLGEGEVWVAAPIGRLHKRIAREGCGNAEFLLLPVHIGDRMPWWWLDKPAQPNARPEDEFGIAWLVTAGARPEGRQHAPISVIAAHSQIVQPQLGQGVAQLTQWRDAGMGAGLLTEGILGQVELPAL